MAAIKKTIKKTTKKTATTAVKTNARATTRTTAKAKTTPAAMAKAAPTKRTEKEKDEDPLQAPLFDAALAHSGKFEVSGETFTTLVDAATIPEWLGSRNCATWNSTARS